MFLSVSTPLLLQSIGTGSRSARCLSPNRSYLVTGYSADGIGAAIALVLAKRGHHVFVTARNTAKIPEALSSLSNVTILSLDVGDLEFIATAAKAVVDSGRGLDVLVNNAGGGYVRPILDIDIAEAQRLYDINLWGPLRMIQAFSEILISSRGWIVNVSSSGSFLNSPWMSTYASSKVALNTYSETLRLELAPFGVSVVTIVPGVIDSKLHVNDEASFNLPRGSRYSAIKDIIRRGAGGEFIPKDGLSAEKFAELVAPMLKYIGRWAPAWLGDYLLSQNQGLKELSQTLAREQNS